MSTTTSEQGRRRKRQRDEEGAGRGEEAAPEVPQSPLFAEVSSDWSHVDVYRVEPQEEQGYLGRVDLNATESDLRGRFGGGKYALRARDAQNRVRSNATITIAGDPIFLSKAAAARWKRAQGQAADDEPAPAPAAPAAVAPAAAPFGVGEILALFQSMQAQQMAAMQLVQQQQQQERQRRDEEDRRREDERRREERDRDERRQKDLDLQRERDREHMQTLLTLATAGNKGGAGEGKILEAFTSGMTTAMKLREEGGGGSGREEGDDDEEGAGGGDVTASTVTAAVRGLVDSVASRFGAAPPPSSAPPPGLPAVSPDDVHLTGPLAEKAKRLVAAAAKAKRDPEEVMSKGLEVMATRLELAAQNTEEKRNGAAKREAAAAAAAAANPGTGSSSPPAPPTPAS